MRTSLRVGIASQTPLARMLRSLEELEADRGPLGDPVSLSGLVRSRDYSVTPGGVARMVLAAIQSSAGGGLTGEWVALSSGFPRDLQVENFRLPSVRIPAERRDGYGRFKEVLWEALNGLPPRVADPDGAEAAPLREDFETFARLAAARLVEAHRREPLAACYVHDFHLLASGSLLPDVPRVLHYHVPIASWTPDPWRRYVLRQMEAFDAVVVSTREYAGALAAEGFARPVHVVPPWIVPEDFERPPRAAIEDLCARFGIVESDEVVLNVGRMDPIKGQDRLIRAMPALLAARPRARLVLVGNGSFSSSKRGGIGLSKGKRWRAELERLVGDLGVGDRVVFTGHLPQADVVAALHRADVFAFPSVAEGFGLAAAEAWLARKPVVVGAGAGISEHVVDGENGWVVPGDDPQAWARRIAGLLADPSAAADLGRRGRDTALRVCDVEENAARVVRALREAVEAPRAATLART